MSDRLKIAFVIDDLGYGGAQRQLSVLSAGLVAVAEPVVFCLSENTQPFAERIRADGVCVVAFRRSRGFELGRLWALAREIRAREVDVVQGFLDASNSYAYLAAKITRRPCALFLQSETSFLHGFRGWFLRRALRGAEQAISNSRAGGKYLSEELSLPPERVAVVPNAVALPPDSGDRAAPADAVVGFVGRLVRSKRVDLLLDAFAELKRTVPGARLVIVGDGPECASLRERARRLGVEGDVEMTGAIDDVGSRLAGFSCLALPSAREGLPNAALEALALGVPVVANAAGDVADLVVDGKTGYLAPGDSPRDLASTLARAIADNRLRECVRREGPALIRSRYSVESAVNRLMSIYKDLARGH